MLLDGKAHGGVAHTVGADALEAHEPLRGGSDQLAERLERDAAVVVAIHVGDFDLRHARQVRCGGQELGGAEVHDHQGLVVGHPGGRGDG